MMSKQIPTVSVIVPVYNEAKTIGEILRRIKKYSIFPTEIIVVDDGSTDTTRAKLKILSPLIDILIFLPKNKGKGSAIRAGISRATGTIVLIQDADLEYSPKEYPTVLQPILDGHADAVYGSRFVGSQAHRVVYFWHYVVNRMITLFSNMLTNLNLSDMETGYKVFKRTLLTQFTLYEDGFGIEPEITAKLAHAQARIYEVGISYHGRTYEEGKKINVYDAIWAVYVIIKYAIILRMSKRKRTDKS